MKENLKTKIPTHLNFLKSKNLGGFTPTLIKMWRSVVLINLETVKSYLSNIKNKTKPQLRKKTTTSSLVSGFTLIETLVAVSILLTAVVAPLTIASRSISYTNFARDQIIASYLAFDALETIIAMRDYNVANGVHWLDGISCPSHTCRIDTSLADINKISVGNCVEDNDTSAETCYMNINGAGLYGYQDGGVQTQFQRIIDIENIPSISDEKRVISRVKFRTGVLTREFSLKLNLFNTGV